MSTRGRAIEALPPAREPAPVESLRRRLAVPFALFALYIIWGSTYLAIRVAVVTIPPFLMGGSRFLFAGCLLYGFLRWRGMPNPAAREWGAAAIVGACLLAGGNGLVGFAEKSVASGLAALLIGTVPLWAALFAGFWERWPTWVEGVGLILGFGGIVLLNAGSSLHGHPLAALILIVASVSWAFGSVWGRHLPMPPGLMASAAEMIMGGVMMMAVGAVRGERLHSLPSSASLLAVLYLIAFGSLIAFSAYTYLLQNVRPALATSYAYVNPVVAVLLGAVLLGEAITGAEIVALIVILAAVGLVVLGRQRARAA